MKRIANLEMAKNIKMGVRTYEDNKKSTLAAIKILVKLGKKEERIKIFNQGKLRFSHRGLYFDYAPYTGKWKYARTSNRKWNSSKSTGDFFERMNAFCDWYDTVVRNSKEEVMSEE